MGAAAPAAGPAVTAERLAAVDAEVVSEGGEWRRAAVSLPARPEHVRAARAFVAGAIGGDHPCAADAVQCASELVANSIRHSRSGRGGAVSVSVLVTPDSVRVEVGDAGGRTVPRIRAVRGLAAGGRGLRLVAATSDDWGHWAADHGRTTWFEIRVPAL
jgi:anti-sigma regulatory factor (Ser/Thr protein kinase)